MLSIVFDPDPNQRINLAGINGWATDKVVESLLNPEHPDAIDGSRAKVGTVGFSNWKPLIPIAKLMDGHAPGSLHFKHIVRVTQ